VIMKKPQLATMRRRMLWCTYGPGHTLPTNAWLSLWSLGPYAPNIARLAVPVTVRWAFSASGPETGILRATPTPRRNSAVAASALSPCSTARTLQRPGSAEAPADAQHRLQGARSPRRADLCPAPLPFLPARGRLREAPGGCQTPDHTSTGVVTCQDAGRA
jgi:hypothetical protein